MARERSGSVGADLSLLAVTAIWGLTIPAIQRALAAVTRTRTVRVLSVSTGSMNEIIPRNVRPPSESVVNSTACP